MPNSIPKERIQPVEPPYSDALTAAFEAAVPPPAKPLRLYRQTAQHETLFVKLVESSILGHRGLLWLGTMSNMDRETVILRSTAQMRAGYEWSVHVAYFGKSSGLSDQQIQATCHAAVDTAMWDLRQRAIIKLVDTVVSDKVAQEACIADNVWNFLQEHLTDSEIVEVISLAGMYRQVSTIATVLRTQPEPGTPAFPGWQAT